MFFFKLKWWWQLTIISLLSLVIYLPIVGNSFVNDDFIVLKKVCIDGNLNTEGFFRPLSDISIWLTCQLAGHRSWPFYLTGILIHAITTLLFISLCRRWRWASGKETQQQFALLAGALFFVYPFHNESVAWILGRGALIASTMGITGLLILVSPANDRVKKLTVCLCYLIGLGFYETIAVLPVMIFIYLALNKSSLRDMLKWAAALSIILVLYSALRVNISGTLAGDYGAGFLKGNWYTYVIRTLKAVGRAFLPPTDHSGLLIVLSLIVLIIGIGGIIYLHRRLKNNVESLVFLYIQISFFLTAMVIPVIGGVSTRTSESDRLLHFPSYFLCAITAFALINIIHKLKWLMLISALMITASVYLLELNNLNWYKASASVRGIVKIIKSRTVQKVYVANLPEEIDGAFVFRVGFKEALLMNKIDTGEVMVLSTLTRDEAMKSPAEITYPGNGHLISLKNALLVYWDKKRWRVINNSIK